MEINFSQVGQNFAEPRDNKVTDILNERQNVALAQEKASAGAKVPPPSAEKKVELNNVQRDAAIQNAITEISEFALASNRQLNFSVDEGSDRPVVKVTDGESGEIIRQIPSEEVLRLSERLKDLQSDVGAAVGVLFSKQV